MFNFLKKLGSAAVLAGGFVNLTASADAGTLKNKSKMEKPLNATNSISSDNFLKIMNCKSALPFCWLAE